MTVSTRLRQTPLPGAHMALHRGDIQTFSLSLDAPLKGTAWIRTNIGHLAVSRKEIVNAVERGTPILGQDWFDIPMRRVHERLFQIRLPLTEVGHAEAKCFFLEDGASDPEWPEGDNTILNVNPADTCCANTIYNAFVRQFGPNKAGKAAPSSDEADAAHKLDAAGYTVIPPSGTFRDLISELDFIIRTLGCRFLHLLPIHPTPTTYARMGRFGSPYAALSFTSVDPALARFDPKATPLEQFIELVDAVHARNARVIIDIAPNHTGWAASLHDTHPEWLVRDTDGRIEVPGAWGVQWEDLTRLDYSHTDLWTYMADVFLAWCHRGVDGFRCDAGYMIPVPAWRYMVARVRSQYPDTIFFLEGLGGKISVMRDILNKAGFDWAYSELFQNYDRGQIESYLPGADAISREDGLLVHFAETHDNNRMATRSTAYARMRTALCALFSQQGGFGFANGVEWLATEKIDVHASPSLNWGADLNQIEAIRRLTTLLTVHPAFHDHVRIQLIQTGVGDHVVLLRVHEVSQKKLVVVVNLDDRCAVTACWLPQYHRADVWDLMTGAAVRLSGSGDVHALDLAPGQVACLTDDIEDIHRLQEALTTPPVVPDRLIRQRLQAKILDIWQVFHAPQDVDDLDIDHAISLLLTDPVACCQSLNPENGAAHVVRWTWPQDVRRHVMAPPGHFLRILSPAPFRGEVIYRNQTLRCEESFETSDGGHCILLTPFPIPEDSCDCQLKLSVYLPDRCTRETAVLRILPRPDAASLSNHFPRCAEGGAAPIFLSTNDRGAMLRASMAWGQLASRYDALLAANLHPSIPENRWIMLTRIRAWSVYQGYSTEICMDCFNAFVLTDRWGFWRFRASTGQGEHVMLTVGMMLDFHENRFQMIWCRHAADSGLSTLPNDRPIQLILRPDIENRCFHDTTKAYLGPETLFRNSVTARPDGFVFHPDGSHYLHVQLSTGRYYPEPEWQYMVHRPLEAERGLDPDSDLFSPGYMSIPLNGGSQAELTAHITSSADAPEKTLPNQISLSAIEALFAAPVQFPFGDALKSALLSYIVRRGELKSVIAGYPWFLDWGRDALIAVRGMAAAGFHQESRDVVIQFGQFEHQGTLPNMICGDDAGNRDTSDAPLWFFTACRDVMRAEGDNRFLDAPCGKRTLRDVLISIGRFYVSGTPGGVRMDPDSGLVFSPAHYSWMDTNHPAGTPREGYPIEIQALWFAALSLLSHHDAPQKRAEWRKLAEKVRQSVMALFVIPEVGFLSDCLHAPPGTSARKAVQDDALRPNQLLAITLGLVTDTALCRNMLDACAALLVPGAIRSLADQPVRRPLEIRRNGQLINDPHHPYLGRYTGDEDTRRKPAYHNGTAWTWLFPSYGEAWLKVYGDREKPTVRSWLYSGLPWIQSGCLGQVPEILDGNYPHTPRGCDAQAWGVSELLRVWLMAR